MTGRMQRRAAGGGASRPSVVEGYTEEQGTNRRLQRIILLVFCSKAFERPGIVFRNIFRRHSPEVRRVVLVGVDEC